MARNPAVNKGPALQDEIRGTEVCYGQAAMWWLGQATFCIKLGRTIIYTDPFFRAEDQDPPTLQELPLKPHEFTDAALICCTHEHLDHIDPLTLPGAAAVSPLAGIVIPAATCALVTGLNVPAGRLLPLRGDDKLERDGVVVNAIPAAHMSLDRTQEHGFRYLGYIFEGNGVTIYHPGDTQPYEGWSQRLSKFNLDVALLPISGNDNLFWQQAVYFCANHRPKLAIPMHYGLFPKYTEDPLVFAKGLSYNVPQQRVKILQVGERFIYGVKNVFTP